MLSNLLNNLVRNIPSGSANVSLHNMNAYKKHYNMYSDKDYYEMCPFNVCDNIHFNNEIKYLKILIEF